MKKTLIFTPAQYRFLVGMALVVSSRIFGLSLILPIIAVYSQSFTESTILIGIALGGYGASQALFQIPYGIASDRYGRKVLIVLGMLVFSIGSLLGAFAESIEILIISRLMQGGGAVTATVFAFINDVIEPRNRNFATALIGAPIGIFFSIGIIIGPIVAHYYNVPALFLLTGIVTGIITLYVIFFIKEEKVSGKREIISKSVLGKLFRDSQLLKIDAAGLLMYSSINAIFFLLPLMMAEKFGMSVSEYVYFYGPMIVGALIFMLVFARIADKGYTKQSILVSFILLCFGSMGMIFADGIYWFGAAAVFAYAGTTILEPILPMFVGKVAPPQVVGTAMGIYSTVQFSGSIIGALAVGLLLPFGYSYAVLTLTCIGVIGIIISLTIKNPKSDS